MQDNRVGPYLILEKIGRGGMGVVYKAQDTRLKRLVALKFLPDEYAGDPRVRERFSREARAASALNHPNICTVYDIGEQDGCAYMVMEYLEGANVKERIAQEGSMAAEEVLGVALQVVDGLEAAHEHGIIHRDVKSANIFVTTGGLVKILDFGLAKMTMTRMSAGGTEGARVDESATDGWALGTVAYMSPEQALGRTLDARTDLFSFGAVLYEMTTGRVPFQGDTTGTLFLAVVQEKPVVPVEEIEGVPAELLRIIGKCLEKDRSKRYGSGAEIREDLLRMKAAPETTDAPAAEEPVAKAERPVRFARARYHVGRLNPQWPWLRIGIISLLILGSYAVFKYRATRARLSSNDTIVLADFTNLTGEAVFEDGLKQALTGSLEQSPFLKVLPDTKVASTLRTMNRPLDLRLGQSVAAEVCVRTKSKLVIAGAIAPEGRGYQISLNALNCETLRPLAMTEEKAEDQVHVLAALGLAASRMRKTLGESTTSLEAYDAPLENATTSSLTALQAYSRGYRALTMQGDPESAIRYFKSALKVDPNFAMAYARLATAYRNTGRTGESNEYDRKAYELRQRVSRREQYFIESNYEIGVNGDFETARNIYEQWAKTYPRDEIPTHNLSWVYGLLNDRWKQIAQLQEAIRVEPGNPFTYASLSTAYANVNRFDEARQVLQQAIERKLDSPALHTRIYMLALLEGDKATAERELAYLSGLKEFEYGTYHIQMQAALYRGQLTRARQVEEQLKGVLERRGNRELQGEYTAELALNEAMIGHFAKAKKSALTALQESDHKNYYVDAVNAYAVALAGDAKYARQMADDLTAKVPRNTSIRYQYVPLLRGAAAQAEGRPAQAIAELEVGKQYEMGDPLVLPYLHLQAVYLRGQAYLAMNQGPEAAAEFEKIINNPGLIADAMVGPLAHLGLARAYNLIGNTEKAMGAYQDFLAHFKDADPDLPVHKQAQAEYAKLTREHGTR